MRKFNLMVLVVLMVFVAFGCGKKSGLEGKVVDGKGKPVANLKIIAKQVQPIKGYEQFETTTDSDGTFSFGKLFPTSEYILFPWYEDWTEAPMRTLQYEANKLVAPFNKDGWTTEEKMKVQSGPEGQTTLLTSPIVIQPCISTVEGKVIDAKKNPLKGIKIIAKQVKPVSGYEKFEATTGSDGSFRFGKLYPVSKYSLVPISKDWKTSVKWMVKAKGEQEAFKLKRPLTIRFTMSISGVITDSVTGLEWRVGPDKDTNWNKAKSWVQGLNLDGGAWRMPTMNELEGLYQKGVGSRNRTSLLGSSGWYVWSGKSKGSSYAWNFNFSNGYGYWYARDDSYSGRAFAVRSRNDG
ncbi:MAG: DUF1566 domain-containing protein [Deltaproteobacteria bacterium]|nr:DUF1566 domain-containing protein [Deltaproteobacteria bacterium]